MSFRYNPVSAEQADESRSYPLLKEGEYKFYVSKAEFGTSKSGNARIEVTLLIHHEGKEYKVFDYLIASESMEWKTRHFCDTCGLLDRYEAGSFNEHLAEKKTGRAYISLEPERPKTDGSGGVWKANNKVDDYVKVGGSSKPTNFKPSQLSQPPNDFINDDVPF